MAYARADFGGCQLVNVGAEQTTRPATYMSRQQASREVLFGGRSENPATMQAFVTSECRIYLVEREMSFGQVPVPVPPMTIPTAAAKPLKYMWTGMSGTVTNSVTYGS